MKVIPAILPDSYEELEDKVELVKSLVPVVQIDICDGHYTPYPTWPYKKHDENFDAIQREEKGLPFWEDVNFEIDLMVVRPEELLAEWVQAGAARIVLHVDSTEKLGECIEELHGKVEIGLAVQIGTDLEKITPHIEKIQFIQCMGIAHIGKQGEPFDPRVLDVITAIKTKFPGTLISVDGGVNEESASSLSEAGVERLVVGSALYTAHNIPQALDYFKSV